MDVMINYFGDSVLTVIAGTFGLIVIAIVLLVIVALVVCSFMLLQLALFKIKWMKEPGWHKSEREAREERKEYGTG